MEEDMTLIMYPEEDDWMMYVGHLQERSPEQSSCQLVVGPAVSTAALSENIKLMFLFNKLRHLELYFSDSSYRYEQSCIAALAELLHLTCLRITGGCPAESVDPSVLFSIKGLKELSILPIPEAGLHADQILGFAWLSTSLTKLQFAAAPEHATDDVLHGLSALQQLQHLSLAPLASSVTEAGLAALAALPSISSLSMGMCNQQVQHLSALHAAKELHLQLHDEHGVDVPNLLSIGGWLLQHNLRALQLGVAQVSDNGLFLSLATLINLRSLNLSLQEAPGCSRAFLNIASLSSLAGLQELAISCTSRVLIPLTAKAVSVLALSWPALRALGLSLAGTPCLAPEALQLLDSFSCLRKLSITAPLDALLQDKQAPSIDVALLLDKPSSATSASAAAAAAAMRSSSLASSLWDLLAFSSSALLGMSSSVATTAAGDGSSGPSTPTAGTLGRCSSRAVSKLDAWLAAREQEMDGSPYYQMCLEYLPASLESLTLELAELRPLPPFAAAAGNRAAKSPPPPPPAAAAAATAAVPGGRLARPVLPNLQHLALDSCKVADAELASLLGRLGQLRSLELAELQDVTDLGLQALAGLSQLSELVVCQLEAGSTVTAASLRAACSCPQLSVLAWATADLALSLGQAGKDLIPLLRRPAKLQKLMLYTRDEGVRAADGPIRKQFDWSLPLVHVSYGPLH